jgi:hypothetical protein
VRRRVSRNNSAMKGDPRPGEALHVGHEASRRIP